MCVCVCVCVCVCGGVAHICMHLRVGGGGLSDADLFKQRVGLLCICFSNLNLRCFCRALVRGNPPTSGRGARAHSHGGAEQVQRELRPGAVPEYARARHLSRLRDPLLGRCAHHHFVLFRGVHVVQLRAQAFLLVTSTKPSIPRKAQGTAHWRSGITILMQPGVLSTVSFWRFTATTSRAKS